MTKRNAIGVLALPASLAVSTSLIWRSGFRGPRDIVNALTNAGVERDDAGRFLFERQSFGGVILAYDPNLRDPIMGWRRCLARIGACMATHAASTHAWRRCRGARVRLLGKTTLLATAVGQTPACDNTSTSARRKGGHCVLTPGDGQCYPGVEAEMNESGQPSKKAL